jgi:hypothetical protein
MGSESDNNEVPSRNSSLSSKGSNIDPHNRSFERVSSLVKKFKDDIMDVEELPEQDHAIMDIYEPPIKMEQLECPN